MAPSTTYAHGALRKGPKEHIGVTLAQIGQQDMNRERQRRKEQEQGGNKTARARGSHSVELRQPPGRQSRGTCQ